MDQLLAWLHTSAWAVHVGGAVTMEFVLRHAQRTMPPSQVAEVCKNAGMRWRWFALTALLVVGLTGALMVLRLDESELTARAGAPRLSLDDAYGRTILYLSAAWALLVAAVSLMAFWAHPAQRRRSSPEMTREQIQLERQRVGRAIRIMDRILRFELVTGIICIAIGASLNRGGLI
ncbi:MAG: hypothetical protein ACE5EF_06215 [Dehalococcoidia bacterium]